MDKTAENASLPIKTKYKKKSQAANIWKRMKRNRIAMVGMVLFTIIILVVIFANAIAPYSNAIHQDMSVRLQGPSLAHLFGTDAYGRDVFARIVYGSRYSVLSGIIGVFVGISLGGILAAIAGYYGGKLDTIIMRVMDTLMSIPLMLLALAIVAALGPGLVNALMALMLAMIPYYTRVIRSAMLTIVGQDFIEAARSCGTPDRFIIIKHILPNAVGTVIVQATMSVGAMIINAAGLSFLGMGIQPPTPEWGAMLSEGKDYMMYAPYLVLFPGLAITITALSLNLMGDGLRDALDPRLKD